MIEFFLPMVPPTVTQQEHAIKVIGGKPIVYDPPELKASRAKFMALLGWQAGQRQQIRDGEPLLPLEGPLRLVTKWCFPIPEGSGRRDGAWKTTKPDTDNLIKLFKDCMTRTGWWMDDAQVCSEVTEKFWAVKPGIWVCVEELDREGR